MTEKSEDEKQLMQAMGLISNAGNAKSLAIEAVESAKKGDFDQAKTKMKEANDALVQAHNTQTKMLTQEANGQHVKLTLLTVHSQDHLMTAITFIDLAKELIDMYQRFNKVEENQR